MRKRPKNKMNNMWLSSVGDVEPLEEIMPNGKPLGECTGEEVAAMSREARLLVDYLKLAQTCLRITSKR